MTLPRFDYFAPRSTDEAVSLWGSGPAASYLSGGTDLLPQLRSGRRAAARVVDLKRVEGLDAIHEEAGGGLRIGSAVPLARVETHPAVLAGFPLLAECCRVIGAWPLRNRATLAGNVCNASPAADTSVALLALEASVRTAGPSGSRLLPVNGFFLGPGKTALLPGEIVAEVVLPSSSTGWEGRYLRLSRRKGMDLATVGVLVARRGTNGDARHRVALAAVAPTPLRVPEAEALLDGGGASAARAAAEAARVACRPITDQRGTAEYRREMVGVLVHRGLVAVC